MSNQRNKYASKRRKKKNKVSKTKVGILVVGIYIALSSVFLVTKGIGGLIKNVTSKIDAQTTKDIPEATKQFDVSEESSSSTKRYTIFIDPGHGGDDKGFKSNATENYEKDLTLLIGKKVASKLSSYDDVNVLISRSDDVNLTNEERLEQAVSQKADILVSIQMNTEGTNKTSASGMEVYYKNNEANNASELATYVHDSILSYVSLKDRGIGQSTDGILRNANMTAIMIRCGFISNPEEEKNFTDEKFLNEYADGLSQGILSYIDANK